MSWTFKRDGNRYLVNYGDSSLCTGVFIPAYPEKFTDDFVLFDDIELEDEYDQGFRDGVSGD